MIPVYCWGTDMVSALKHIHLSHRLGKGLILESASVSQWWEIQPGKCAFGKGGGRQPNITTSFASFFLALFVDKLRWANQRRDPLSWRAMQYSLINRGTNDRFMNLIKWYCVNAILAQEIKLDNLSEPDGRLLCPDHIKMKSLQDSQVSAFFQIDPDQFTKSCHLWIHEENGSL